MVQTLLSKGTATIVYTDELAVDTAEDATRVLDEHGVAVLRGVVSEQDCYEIVTSLAATAAHITQRFEEPFDYCDRSKWSAVSELGGLGGDGTLHQQWGFSHDPKVWQCVRANDGIIDTFAKLYDVNKRDLVASIDGVNYGPRTKGFSGHHKLHCDERYSPVPFATVQGWVSPLDVPVGSGTLRFLDGSHKYKEEYKKTYASEFADPDNHAFDAKSDWHVVSKDSPSEFYRSRGCVDSAITCKAGDLVLWKSSTVHAGIEAWKDEDLVANGVPPLQMPFRIAAYVSYMPRSECRPSSFEKRRKILMQSDDPLFGRSCSHYADMRRTFPLYPVTYPRLARVKADEKWAHVTPYKPDPTIFEDDETRRVAGL